MLTVADVLAEPVVRRGHPEVLAGEDALGSAVRWIHVTEFADIASVLRGGELLLTTGIALPRSSAEQRTWVNGLVDRGVAALVIELGSTLRAVPSEVRQAAVAAGLPLVALHRPVPFVSITEALHPRISGAEVAELRAAQAVSERLTHAALAGEGTLDLLLELEEALGGPVWVARTGGDTIHGAPLTGDDVVRAPIRLGGDDAWATLSLAASSSVPPSVVRAAADQAAALVGLLLRRSSERDALSLSHAGAFLADLVGERHAGDELALRERAGGFGMSLHPRRLTPVVVIAAGSTSAVEEWAGSARRIRQALEATGIPAIVGAAQEGRALLAVCDLRGGEGRARAGETIVRAVDAAGDLGPNPRLRVCVGASEGTWTALRDALRATIQAAPVVRAPAETGWVDVAVPDLDDLLWTLRDEDVARRFVDRRLRPLVDADERRGTSLLATLTAFCEHGGRKAETARTLMVERQSLYKRLRRVEEVLGVDLEDQRTVLELHLAVLARRSFSRSADSLG